MPQVRIRTVKPALFLHDELFLAEEESGLPLRLAFIGLFGHCCRDGLFPWRPLKLGAHILPYDGLEFSRVLDALMSRGFLEKYATDSGEYLGRIPTFLDHQNINPKESKSPYPPLDMMTRVGLDDAPLGIRKKARNPDARAAKKKSTRQSRDDNATATRESLKGKERKGKERNINTYDTSSDVSPVNPKKKSQYPDEFEQLWAQYPHRQGNNSKENAYKAYKARLKAKHTHEEMLAGVLRYAAYVEQTNQSGSQYVQMASTFLGTSENFLQPWKVNHEANQRANSELSAMERFEQKQRQLAAEQTPIGYGETY